MLTFKRFSVYKNTTFDQYMWHTIIEKYSAHCELWKETRPASNLYNKFVFSVARYNSFEYLLKEAARDRSKLDKLKHKLQRVLDKTCLPEEYSKWAIYKDDFYPGYYVENPPERVIEHLQNQLKAINDQIAQLLSHLTLFRIRLSRITHNSALPKKSYLLEMERSLSTELEHLISEKENLEKNIANEQNLTQEEKFISYLKDNILFLEQRIKNKVVAYNRSVNTLRFVRKEIRQLNYLYPCPYILDMETGRQLKAARNKDKESKRSEK